LTNVLLLLQCKTYEYNYYNLIYQIPSRHT
jgi:hypothetical protein